MRHRLSAGVVTIVGVLSTAVPAMAQAKGSAEASAAAVVNPKWTPSKLTWGHPDLEGIWTSDDMRGVPMSRPAQFGTRKYLTDEEFAQRAGERSKARDFDNARTGTFRNEEGSRDFGYTSLVVDPADGRVPALTPEARARRPIRRRAVPYRAVMRGCTTYDIRGACVVSPCVDRFIRRIVLREAASVNKMACPASNAPAPCLAGGTCASGRAAILRISSTWAGVSVG